MLCRIVEIVDAQELFDAHVALLGERGGLRLFFDGVVVLRLELRNNGVDAVVEIGALVRRVRR